MSGNRDAGSGRRVVLGADVGGTSTRVVVATTAGEALALRSGPGGNPNRVGLSDAAARVEETIRQVLDAAGAEPSDVLAATVALAGATRVVSDPRTLTTYLDQVTPAGVAIRPAVVQDVAAAYASGSAAPRGVVLVAGTGSIAAEVDDGQVLRRRGGWGWLLGDEGSGQWLGREAVRVVAGRLERGEPAGPLGDVVLSMLGATASLDSLLARTYDGPVQRLASLGAPVALLVDTDPAAADLTRRAADALVGLVASVASPLPPAVVLAGSVLAPGSVVGDLVRHHLAASGVLVASARTGVVGSVWLALTAAQAAAGESFDRAELHARLGASVAALEGRHALGDAGPTNNATLG